MRRLGLIGMLAAVTACNAGGEMPADNAALPSLRDVPGALRQRFSLRKIYFGHQSVGDNILAGLAQIMKGEPDFQLNVVRGDDPALFDRPVLVHSALGSNGDPASKISAFDAAVRAGIGGKADIALLKLCFWDIRSTTDVPAVFRLYRDTLAALRKDYPTIAFVHVTVPLTVRRDGITQRLKGLLGRPDAWDLDNRARAELNDLLLGEYQGKEPVFDLARAESTLPDGRRVAQLIGGRPVFSLAARYSRDGAHLNDEGARWVAAQFLVTLARATAGRSGG
jgi:hypothetical protein